jgi:two-component system chemotaxis sensor kinase CheA
MITAPSMHAPNSRDSMFDDAIREFLIESQEGLDCFEHDLVKLEREQHSPALLDGIFRVIHTIKGSGGTLGFHNLLAISHVGESVLSRMRDGSLLLTPAITSTLLGMTDSLRHILNQIDESGHEADGDHTAIVQRLSRLLSESPSSTSVEPEPAPPQRDPDATPTVGEILVASRLCEPQDVQAALKLQNAGDARKVGEILLATGATSPADLNRALKLQAEHRDLTSSTLRVDVDRLDKVMNLVGELVLARNQIVRSAVVREDPGFQNIAQRLNAITTELQGAVMKTRMQLIGRLWEKLPRMVRDLTVGCGKLVEISFEGADTDLDKTVIEAIKDPLIHMVRNAVDHGIEAPDFRLAKGKAPVGQVRLRAFHEGGQVNVEIADDGEGIPVERLRQKAVEKGLMEADDAAGMSDQELLKLIFLPGLSTAEQVSNISGRGVGMDVVKTNIEKIGGTIHLESAAGKGTRVTIRIPLTLTIMSALIVSSRGRRFAIPQANVVELAEVGPEGNGHSLEEIGGAMVYRLRGHLLPLLYLDRLLQLAPADQESAGAHIVVVQAAERQFGLLVDEINDSQEIVVKPLSRELRRTACFAGATIMGDGLVALVLDIPGLTRAAGIFPDLHPLCSTTAHALPSGHPAKSSWLLFRLGDHGRLALPLSAISRLEEIPAASVERSGEREILQYRQQLMPLVRLSQALGHSGSAEQETLQVIVHAHHGQYVGLVVDEILDVVDQESDIPPALDAGALKRVGVLEQRITDLVDLPALLRHQCLAFPEPQP